MAVRKKLVLDSRRGQTSSCTSDRLGKKKGEMLLHILPLEPVVCEDFGEKSATLLVVQNELQRIV